MKRSRTTISEGLGSTIRKITLKASDYQTWTAMEIGSLLADPDNGADLQVQKVAKLLPIFEDNKTIEQILNYSTNEVAVQKIIERVQSYMSIAESVLLLTTVEVCVSYFREKFKVGDELHVSLLRFSDKFIPVAPGILPYENNKGTVKSMGRILVENIYWHKFGTIRNQTLLVNSDYFGSGKTRLGIEFLNEWKQQLQDNPQEKDWLSKTYSE